MNKWHRINIVNKSPARKAKKEIWNKKKGRHWEKREERRKRAKAKERERKRRWKEREREKESGRREREEKNVTKTLHIHDYEYEYWSHKSDEIKSHRRLMNIHRIKIMMKTKRWQEKFGYIINKKKIRMNVNQSIYSSETLQLKLV